MGKPSVLVVDGDLAGWRWMKEAIQATTRFCRKVEEGLAIASEWLPDVIAICAVVQHDDAIRALWRFKQASVRSTLIVTGYEYDESDAQRALDAGAFIYVSKDDALLLRAAVRAAAAIASPVVQPLEDDETD